MHICPQLRLAILFICFSRRLICLYPKAHFLWKFISRRLIFILFHPDGKLTRARPQNKRRVEWACTGPPGYGLASSTGRAGLPRASQRPLSVAACAISSNISGSNYVNITHPSNMWQYSAEEFLVDSADFQYSCMLRSSLLLFCIYSTIILL